MKLYSATYDTKFVATVDAKGRLAIAEVPGESFGSITLPADGIGVVVLSPKAAKPILSALEDASETHGYGDDEINTVQHWILARAYQAASVTA